MGWEISKVAAASDLQDADGNMSSYLATYIRMLKDHNGVFVNLPVLIECNISQLTYSAVILAISCEFYFYLKKKLKLLALKVEI